MNSTSFAPQTVVPLMVTAISLVLGTATVADEQVAPKDNDTAKAWRETDKNANSAKDDAVPQAALRRAARVTPSPRQLAWQNLEQICFVHFGINTFTDREWGDGKEDPALFHPTALDARQWARVCKESGMKLLILTCKHHDGFCLWPSRYTEHSVKNSPWRDGKGDVVREAADACREYGIKFGIYLSPWDRHEPTYGTDAYNTYYKNQLRELLTDYGEIAEVWWDGACGEGPNGKKQVYDWEGYTEVVRQLQPGAVIFGMGPDVRWVGNEDGLARESEWSVLPRYDARSWRKKDLGHRKYLADAKELIWFPAECDVSIRKGWFYHASQNDTVKSLAKLLDIYYRSVGRNSVLLLNIPPDRRGLFHENDVARLKEFRAALDATFDENLAAGRPVEASSVRSKAAEYAPQTVTDGDYGSYWMPEPDTIKSSLIVVLEQPVAFNRAMVREQIAVGQRIEHFVFDAWNGERWESFAEGTTVGYKRLLRFPTVTTSRVRLRIEQARDCPTIAEVGLFLAPKEYADLNR